MPPEGFDFTAARIFRGLATPGDLPLYTAHSASRSFSSALSARPCPSRQNAVRSVHTASVIADAAARMALASSVIEFSVNNGASARVLVIAQRRTVRTVVQVVRQR